MNEIMILLGRGFGGAAFGLSIFGTALGLLFAILTVRGVAINGAQCLIAIDQWLATCLIAGAHAGETISAAVHRRQWQRSERFINWLFRDDLRCAKAYITEFIRANNATSYHQEK